MDRQKPGMRYGTSPPCQSVASRAAGGKSGAAWRVPA